MSTQQLRRAGCALKPVETLTTGGLCTAEGFEDGEVPLAALETFLSAPCQAASAPPECTGALLEIFAATGCTINCLGELLEGIDVCGAAGDLGTCSAAEINCALFPPTEPGDPATGIAATPDIAEAPEAPDVIIVGPSDTLAAAPEEAVAETVFAPIADAPTTGAGDEETRDLELPVATGAGADAAPPMDAGAAPAMGAGAAPAMGTDGGDDGAAGGTTTPMDTEGDDGAAAATGADGGVTAPGVIAPAPMSGAAAAGAAAATAAAAALAAVLAL